MHVAVAAGALARLQCLFYFGNCGAIVLGKRLNPLRLRFHLQQRLLEVEIDRQLMGKMEGERGSIGLDFRALSQNGKKLLVQLDQRRFRISADLRRLIIKLRYLALKVRTLLVQALNLKPLPAFSSNVEPAIIIFFDYVEDRGGAADRGQGALLHAHHAEWTLLLQALADHLFVARLKDMQRQRRSGKEHDFKRK